MKSRMQRKRLGKNSLKKTVMNSYGKAKNFMGKTVYKTKNFMGNTIYKTRKFFGKTATKTKNLFK